ncbi:MAG: tyrosine-type recombinase/integrase, partial [Desulfotomaculales bacterium]
MKTAQNNTEGAKNFLHAFLEHLAGRGASGHTLAGYRRDLLAFFSWFRETTGEDAAPERVTSVDLREHQSFLRGRRGLKPNTVNRRLKAVKAWLVWAVKEGLAPRLPEFPRDVPQARQAPQSLGRAEVNRLLREVEKENNPRDAALIRLLLSCGLRVGEAVSLKVSDLDLGGRHGMVTVRYGKGSKHREVPVPPEARKALRVWLERHPGGEWLFPGGDGHLTVGSAWRAVRKYAWRAGTPNLRPHQLRHTCAKNMLRA